MRCARRSRATTWLGIDPPRALVALAELLPTCAHCERRPAACFGCDEGEEGGPAAACDVCCGHGNEDGWCVPIAELPAWAATQRRKLADADAEVVRLRARVATLEEKRGTEPSLAVRLAQRELARMAAAPVAVAPLPERAAEVRARLAAIDRASQQLYLEAAHDQEDAAPAGGEMPVDVADVIAALEAVGRGPAPIAVVPHRDPAEAARIAEIEAELAKARRAVAFFTKRRSAGSWRASIAPAATRAPRSRTRCGGPGGRWPGRVQRDGRDESAPPSEYLLTPGEDAGKPTT